MFIEEQLKKVRQAGYSRSAWVEYARMASASVKAQIWNNPQATRSVLITGTVLFVLHILWSLRVSFLLGPEHALDFLWGGGLSTLAITVICLGHLELVRDRSGTPCASLSPADWLSLARFTMAPGVVMLTAWREWRLALGWIVVAGATDVLDGMLARRMGGETVLGTVFDPIVDIAFNTCMFVGLSLSNVVPQWLLALVVLRYSLVVFGAIFLYVTRGPVRIQPTIFGKVSGVLIHVLLIAEVGLKALDNPELTQRSGALLDLSLAFLCTVTVVHVVVMGWANLKLASEQLQPPKVVADVPFRSPRRREP